MADINSSPSNHAPGRKTAAAAVLRWTLAILTLSGLLVGTAFLVIYPLWYLAVNQTAYYTAGVMLVFAALIVLLFLLRLRRAVRDSRLDEFYLKIVWGAALIAFLLSQFFLAAVNITLFSLLPAESNLLVPCGAIGLVAVLISLSLVWAGHRREIFRKAGFIVCLVLFGLQAAYWTSVFVVNGAYLYSILIVFSILGFFFSVILTKIVREKKNPSDEKTRL